MNTKRLSLVLLIVLFSPTIGIISLNIVVITDECIAFDGLLEMATRILKGSKTEVGEWMEICFGSDSDESWKKLENLYKSMGETKKEDKPNFLFDFTLSNANSILLKNFVSHHPIPLISTNYLGTVKWFSLISVSSDSKGRQTSKTEKKFIDLTTNLNYTVGFRPPTKVLEKFIYQIQLQARISDAIVFSEKVISYPYIWTYFTVRPPFAEVRADSGLKTYGFNSLLRSIDTGEASGIFLYGTKDMILSTLKKAAEFNDTIFDERYSWWAIQNDLDTPVECPTYVQKLMLIRPETDFAGSRTALYTNTKSISDLFYLDVILSIVQTVGDLQQSGLWPEDPTQLDLRSPIATRMARKDNILGRYSTYELGILQPNLGTYKIELIKPGGKIEVGEVRLQVSSLFELDIINWDAMNQSTPAEPVNAVVVVDPPFVIRNETCFETKEADDDSLSCYEGYVVDILNKILAEKLYIKLKVISEDEYGETNDGKAWTGARGEFTRDRLIYKKTSPPPNFGVGAFHKQPVEYFYLRFSEPFYHDTKRNRSLSFLFAPYLSHECSDRISLEIRKLKSLRYLDILEARWFGKSVGTTNSTSPLLQNAGTESSITIQTSIPMLAYSSATGLFSHSMMLSLQSLRLPFQYSLC